MPSADDKDDQHGPSLQHDHHRQQQPSPQAAAGDGAESVYDDISSAFVDEIFRARCDDLGIAPSPEAFRRFETVLKRKVVDTTFDMAQNGMGPASAACISKWLAGDDLFDRVDLSRNAIGNAGAAHVADLVRANPNLTSLTLRSNDITASGVVDLAGALSTSTTMTSLDLSSDTGFQKNTLGDRGAQALSQAIAACPTLTSVSLGNVGSAGLAHVSQACMARVQHLDLRANNIGDDACAAVLAPLASSAALTHLNLSRNALTDVVTPAIVSLLSTSSSSLRHLDLSHNGLSRAFALGVRSVLETPDTARLQTLILDGNARLGQGKGHTPLIQGCMRHPWLTTLSLVRCAVKDCSTIAQMLKENTVLQRLYLAQNAIDDDDAVGIGKALAGNAALVVLDLSENSVGDAAGVAIADGLSTNTTLQELVLKDNSLTDVTATAILAAIRSPSAASSLNRLSLRLNSVSLKVWVDLEAALRANRNNLRQHMIVEYHGQLADLQHRERQARERVEALRAELSARSAADVRAEVDEARDTLPAFKDDEERQTREMREHVLQGSNRCRAAIKDATAAKDALESEYRRAYRAFVSQSHKLDLKVGSEQRKKGNAFRALRKLQKAVAEQSAVVRERTLLQRALEQQLQDERDASRWLQDAVQKWTAKIEKLTGQITLEYSQGIQTYLEMLVPAPAKTTRVKARWQRVREKRMQLLVEFNAAAFMAWFLDPTRPAPNRRTAWRAVADANDPNAGYVLHVKVVTSAAALDAGRAKTIHASHSVYSMALHGMGQLSTILVALHDPALATEFRTVRTDVSHVVLRAAGHVKIDDLRGMIAGKIGVDEADISGLYHTVNHAGGWRAGARRLSRRRASLHADDDDDTGTDSSDLTGDDDEDGEAGAQQAPVASGAPASKKARRKRGKVVTEVRVPSAAPARHGTALEEVQSMFPDPESDDDDDDSDDDDDGDGNDDDDGGSGPPAHRRQRRARSGRAATPALQRPTLASQRRGSDPATAPTPTSAPPAARRHSLPPETDKATRRRYADLMTWSYHHSPMIMIERRPLAPVETGGGARPDASGGVAAAAAAAADGGGGTGDVETRLRSELVTAESTLGPMHPAVSTTLTFMGAYYSQMHLWAEAEAAYLRALHIREKAFGRRHPHVATVLHSLAQVYAEQPERLEMAEPFLVRAIAVREKTLGRQNPIVADSLTSLGRLYERIVRWQDRAEPLFVRSLTIRERIYGKRHALVLESLQDLARVYERKQRQLRRQHERSGDDDDGEAHDGNDHGNNDDGDDDHLLPIQQRAMGARPRVQVSKPAPLVSATMGDLNPAYKLDSEEGSPTIYRNTLRPAFRPVSLRVHGTTSQQDRASAYPDGVHSHSTLDFSDAGAGADATPWITKRRLLNVKPWNKLVHTQTPPSYTLPRVQFQGGGPLSLLKSNASQP